METDDVAIITLGTVLWALALVVLLVLDEPTWAWVSAAGAFLGVIGIRYVRRRRAALRSREDPSESETGPNLT